MSYITIDNLTNIMAEMTDYCNAACPMCNRYDWDLNLVKGVTNTHHTTLDFVKQRIGEEVISKLNGWLCQGTYGDASMNPETIDIFKYLKGINPNIKIGMITNGGARNTEFWKTLAELNVCVTFSIDGLEDTNHIYRVGVQFKKIMENAQAYIDAGASAHWDMLVFDHNKHQVDECRQLADTMGFTWFRSKETDRWDQYQFDHLKPANKINEVDYQSIDRIHCERNIEESTYVDYKGQEFPCCHISEMYYDATQKESHLDIRQYTPSELMTEYQKRLDDKNPFYVCKRSCGETVSKRSQWKQEIQLR